MNPIFYPQPLTRIQAKRVLNSLSSLKHDFWTTKSINMKLTTTREKGFIEITVFVAFSVKSLERNLKCSHQIKNMSIIPITSTITARQIFKSCKTWNYFKGSFTLWRQRHFLQIFFYVIVVAMWTPLLVCMRSIFPLPLPSQLDTEPISWWHLMMKIQSLLSQCERALNFLKNVTFKFLTCVHTQIFQWVHRRSSFFHKNTIKLSLFRSI